MAAREHLNLADFKARYPWPDTLLGQGKPLEWLWYFDLPTDRESLWNQVSDTSRLNRALGQPEMKLEEREGELHGESRVAGMRLTWIEQPWEWIAGRSLQAIRLYHSGFARVGRAIYRLESLDAETVRYYVYFGWIPRGLLGKLLLRIGMPRLKQGYTRVLDRIVGELAKAPSARPLDAEARALSDSARDRLGVIRGQLRTRMAELDRTVVDSDKLIDHLIDHIANGDELDLYRIQIKVLARRWGVELFDLLRLCLHATRVGLLTMSWDLVCPHCRGTRDEAQNLGDVNKLGECEVCDIDFAADKENAIEITFHVHPSIRAVSKRFFCSAEPASKMHIRVQRRLAAGASYRVTTDLGPGRYRLRLRGQERYRFLDVTTGRLLPTARWIAEFDAGASGPDEHGGDALEAGPDPVVEMINNGTTAHTFVIENAAWADVALRPAELFNVQDFRDLFSEQYLGADLQLDVGEQTILFTDMVGSTLFYATRGDPEAFVEIKKHFAQIYAIVARHHGAVVKTIGDAVMAAFGNPVDAVKASHDIHRCFHDGRADTPVRVRISLNTGPCIAVNFQNNVDYFGGTVNLAAKLQACADAGDIAMSPSVITAPGVRQYLTEEGAALHELNFKPRSLDETVHVTRWATFDHSWEDNRRMATVDEL
ncbi:MAG: adenylate/guanylate cyclase domain-containing protein [Myxococcota bacterium]